jgi:hypothetical protein
MNPWRVVEGKFPTQMELSEWPHDKWMDYLRFLEFFIGEGKNGEMYQVNALRVKQVEAFLGINDHPWHEFLYRINVKSSEPPRAFYGRFQNLAKIGLTFLKRHPGKVSEEMDILMKKYPKRMGWALSQFIVTDSPHGEIVQRDTKIRAGYNTENVKLPSITAKLFEGQLKVADIFVDIANSLTKTELRALETKDKISALSKLAPILAMAGRKTASNHFTQINLNGNVKDMEAAMLDYVKKKAE